MTKVIVYRSLLEQQTDEFWAMLFASGDAIYLFGGILLCLAALSLYMNWKTKGRRRYRRF